MKTQMQRTDIDEELRRYEQQLTITRAKDESQVRIELKRIQKREEATVETEATVEAEAVVEAAEETETEATEAEEDSLTDKLEALIADDDV